MTTYIALLRGINVGGRKMVAMSDLRAMLDDLGFGDARSLLQSGNLLFRSKTGMAAGIERTLEQETERRLDLRTVFFVRSAAEWKKIVARNPFPDEAKSDPGHLVVLCLKDAARPAAVKALQTAIKGPEIVRADGKQLYVVYPNGIGTSKLTNKLIEDKLGTQATGRNWNTALKLAELTSG